PPRRLIADAQLIESARREVLHDQIGLARQVGKDVAGAGMLQVEGHTQFVAKPVEGAHRDIVVPLPGELHTAQSEVRRVLSGRIAAGRVFNLDDACAKAPEPQRWGRSRKGNGEIENRKVAEWRFSRLNFIHDAAAACHRLSSRVNPEGKTTRDSILTRFTPNPSSMSVGAHGIGQEGKPQPATQPSCTAAESSSLLCLAESQKSPGNNP